MEPIIVLMFIVFIVAFIAPVALRMLYVKSSTDNSTRKNAGKDVRKYDRAVDPIHITSDAESEYRRRLEQLKSLYDAGMMESEEYYERKQDIEDDFRQNRNKER